MHHIFTLIIVDDEKTIRQGLKTCINWESLGFKIIGEASNGNEAITLIENIKPDVILTDIRMENMDGMELIEYVHKKHSEIKVILISGYSNLEYYQKALKYMIFDYILKPTKIDVIKEVFTKLYTTLEEHNEKELLIKNMKTQLDSSLPLAKEQFFTQMLKGQLDNDTINHYKNNFNLTFPNNNFRLVAFSLLKNTYPLKGIVEALTKHFNIFCFENSGIIISLWEDRKRLKVDIQSIINFITRQYRIATTVSCSSNCSDIIDIGLMYNQICSIKNEQLFNQDENTIVFFEEIENNYNRFDNIEEVDVTNIILAIQNGDLAEIKRLIENFFAAIKSNPIPYDYLSYILNKIYYSAFLSAYKNGLKVSPIPDFNIKLNQQKELTKKKEFLLSKLEKLTEIFEQSTVATGNKTIMLINRIITKEYNNNNMSLTYLSNKTGKSEAYISALYKESEGINILERITNLRIEEAKIRLEKTNEKIYEIAKGIGYTDVSYFCKLFKRQVGLSPAEYRRINL